LSGLPLGMRSSKRRRSANNDSDCVAWRKSSQNKRAIDEKHAAVRIARAAGRGPDASAASKYWRDRIMGKHAHYHNLAPSLPSAHPCG